MVVPLIGAGLSHRQLSENWGPPQLDFARLRGVAERVRHTLGEVAVEFLWVRALV